MTGPHSPGLLPSERLVHTQYRLPREVPTRPARFAPAQAGAEGNVDSPDVGADYPVSAGWVMLATPGWNGCKSMNDWLHMLDPYPVNRHAARCLFGCDAGMLTCFAAAPTRSGDS